MRAASSSSWSFPMVSHRAAPHAPRRAPAELQPGGPLSSQNDLPPRPQPLPPSGAQPDSCSPFQTNRSSSRREEENHLLLVSLDHFWVECGGEGGGGGHTHDANEANKEPPHTHTLPCTHPEPRPGGRSGQPQPPSPVGLREGGKGGRGRTTLTDRRTD